MRRRSRKQGKKGRTSPVARPPSPAVQAAVQRQRRREKKAQLERSPSGAAVLLTVEAGGSYADIMRRAAAAVDLKDLGFIYPVFGSRRL